MGLLYIGVLLSLSQKVLILERFHRNNKMTNRKSLLGSSYCITVLLEYPIVLFLMATNEFF